MPFGPEISWPGGYPNLEYREGDDYRYHGQAAQYPGQSQPALPAARGHGEHPYAAYESAGYAGSAPDAFGYGDPGYSDPGYDGPSSQDAGIAGTRTVRGFVESGQDHGYPGSGYQDPGYQGRSALPASPADYAAPGYGQPANYSQPWDYEQPLRYDGEEPTYLGAPTSGPGAPSGGYGRPGYDAGERDPRAYDPAAYNGSELSQPGIGGPGYDLSGIIGTADFPSFGYDEPSVQRLSYDDPRYDDSRSPGGSRYDEPRFDETRLDGFWGVDDRPSGPHPGPRGEDGAGRGGRDRSEFGNELHDGGRPPRGAGAGYGERASGGRRGRRSDETRLDLGYRADETRFDVPAYGRRSDETRMEDMRALAVAPTGRSATGLLAPPPERPRSWHDETSLDSFAGLNIDELPGLHEESSRAVATALREAPPARQDTGSQRAGRRRGRSSDRRQWLALGGVAILAVGAMGFVLSKFMFAGSAGPAHTISTPTSLDSYTRSPSLEKATDLNAMRAAVIRGSSGQASDVISAVYAQGNTTPGSANQQEFVFIGGHLANTDPAASIASFKQEFPGAQVVPAGTLGGQASCTTTQQNGSELSMCVWFDNDTFGTLASPSMSPRKLATTMDQVRPGLEQLK